MYLIDIGTTYGYPKVDLSYRYEYQNIGCPVSYEFQEEILAIRHDISKRTCPLDSCQSMNIQEAVSLLDLIVVE